MQASSVSADTPSSWILSTELHRDPTHAPPSPWLLQYPLNCRDGPGQLPVRALLRLRAGALLFPSSFLKETGL